MTTVSVTELRIHLKDYLDKLESGETVDIIRNSIVIGHLVPSEEIKKVADTRHARVAASVKLSDDREVQFRQYGRYEDPEPIRRLHRVALQAAGAYSDDPAPDSDLLAPASYYSNWGGEFWVGDLDGQVVATGAFRLHLTGATKKQDAGEAELKRMSVSPDLQSQGIGTALLNLLEARARQRGYTTLVLDTVVGTPAQGFYEQHGFQETRRQRSEKLELVYYKKEL